MKKIYSFAFAAVAILSAASCQQELANEALENIGGGNFTVTAATAETKTALAEDGFGVVWTPGDKISVFNAEGKPVSFSTTITEKAATAEFTNDAAFSAPTSLLAVYPHRGDVQLFNEGKINNFRVAGGQTAVAGSFDPTMAGAVGLPVSEGSTELKFTSVHALIGFTLVGETVPTTVTLVNDKGKMIAGLYEYDVVNNKVINTGAASSINLTGSFESGKTYYFVVIPHETATTLSLQIDGITAKTSKEITIEPNKIYNFGEVEAPKPGLAAELVCALQSHGNDSYMTTFGGEANRDRNIAIDGDYIYIPETKGTAAMWKVSMADKTATAMPVTTVDGGGTFALCCPRFIKNTDETINGGKDVLVVSSMGMGDQETYLYFYKNGLDSDPHKVALHNGGNMNRRLGDIMTVYGTMQSWSLYYKEQGSSAIISYGGTNRVLEAADIWPAGRNYMDPTTDNAKGAIYFYSSATAGVEGIVATDGNGKYGVVDANVLHEDKPVYVAQEWTKDPSLAGCFGFNFFKHNGSDYIAYTSFTKKTLYIIKGASSADGVKAALEANEVVFSAPIAATDNACGSGNTAADCAVYQDANKTYVAGHIQNVGVVVYELK